MNRCFGRIIALILLFSSCSSNVTKDVKKGLVRPEEIFSYSDKNGQFQLKLSSGFTKKDQTFFSKRSLEIPNRSEDHILEQSITISSIGALKKKQVILRPKLSQYSVWFEGKKYFSEIKLNLETRMMDVKMVSPEPQWSGSKQFKLPADNALYCYFSQIIECAKTTGFIGLATKNETGTMNFYVVWESYPYTNELYTGFSSELFSRAQLEYDGRTKDGERRLILKVLGQSVFFIIDDEEQMKKMFWVSQGISMVSRSNKKNSKYADKPTALKFEKKPEKEEGEVSE